MAKLFSIIGVLVMCAGIDLLWQSRRDARYWLATFVTVLRSLLGPRESSAILSSNVHREGRHQLLRIFLGMSFVLILGPIFLALGVTFMFFYPNL